MEILENVKWKGGQPGVILMLEYKEAKVFCDAMETYTKANKRKKIAKALLKQMYDTMPY